VKTMIYIKMYASEQLLLGKGVSRQLGIVTYHTDVEPCQESAASPCEAALVPVVRV